MKRKFFLSVFLVIVLILGHSFLAIKYPDVLMGLALLILPAFLLSLALIGYTPVSRQTLGVTVRYSLAHWWLRLALGQILMMVLFLNVLMVFFFASPTFVNGPELFEQWRITTMHYERWPWLGLPWLPSIIWGLSLSYFTYQAQQAPFHHNHANVLYKGKFAIFSKAYIEMLVQIPTQIALMMGVAVAVMGGALAIHLLKGWPLYSTYPILVATLLLMFPLANSKACKQWARALARRRWGLGEYVLVMAALLLCFLIMLSGIIDTLGTIDVSNWPLQAGRWLNYLPETPRLSRLTLFYWGWWLIWTPLLSSYYAAISEGRAVGTYLIGVSLIPLISHGVLHHLDSVTGYLMQHPILILCISMISLLTMVGILYQQKTSQRMVTGMMPQTVSVPVGRTSLLQGTRIYGLSHFLPRFVLGTLAVVVLQATAGWYIMGVVLAVFVPCIIYKTLGMSGILLIKLFKRRHTRRCATR